MLSTDSTMLAGWLTACGLTCTLSHGEESQSFYIKLILGQQSFRETSLILTRNVGTTLWKEPNLGQVRVIFSFFLWISFTFHFLVSPALSCIEGHRKSYLLCVSPNQPFSHPQTFERDIEHQKREPSFYDTIRGTMVQTLNNMEELRDSEFGRPKPRHGLKLLYWFANNYIVFNEDHQMVAQYDPDDGDFGFHPFHNRLECGNNDCRRLLPDDGNQFFEVGNLHFSVSKSMPKYVWKDYSGYPGDSNMDRLIISMRPDEIVDKVYVTQHDDLMTFDPVNTYRISRGLLMIICGHRSAGMSLGDFLNQVGYSTHRSSIYSCESSAWRPAPSSTHRVTTIKMQAEPVAPPGFWDSFCTIL
uniref:Uncharacterized protein n=1 Tax=Esox lucius TaxID=8010 RepID=A0AAY5KZN2_ESOLU